MTGDEWAMFVQSILYCVPIIGLVVSGLTFYRSSRERHEKSAAEQAGISAKLDTIDSRLDSTDTHLKQLLQGQMKNTNDIVLIDGRVTALDTRVNGLETRISSAESRIDKIIGKGA